MRSILLTLLILYTFATIAAEKPILQIDSGGHKALIRDVVFTPDGRYLVSASDDKLIRVWDLKTGRTMRTLRGQLGAGHEGKIFAMALSPDGRWLAAGGFMGTFTGSNPEAIGTIRLYDFPTGKLVALLKGHTNVVYSLAFSPDSRYLVSGSADKDAILWDVKRQHRITLQGHTGDINAVAFTPDSKRVVTGSSDNTLRLWQVQDGQQIATLTGHTDQVSSVAILPQDGSIASGSDDKSIRLWNGWTGHFLKTLANQGTQVGSLSFSPDGRYLLSGVSMQREPFYCHVYSYPSGKKRFTYKGHNNIVRAITISPDGHWAATGGGSDQAIHIWALRDGKLKQRLVGAGASTWAVGFSDDGKTLAWGKTGIQQYNQAGKLEYRLTLPTPNRPLGVPKALPQARLNQWREWIRQQPDQNYHRAQDQWRGWTLRTRQGGNYGYQAILEIRHQNRTQARIERGVTDGLDHRSYTFTPTVNVLLVAGVMVLLPPTTVTAPNLATTSDTLAMFGQSPCHPMAAC